MYPTSILSRRCWALLMALVRCYSEYAVLKSLLTLVCAAGVCAPALAGGLLFFITYFSFWAMLPLEEKEPGPDPEAAYPWTTIPDLCADGNPLFYMKLLPGLCFFCELAFFFAEFCKNGCMLPIAPLFWS